MDVHAVDMLLESVASSGDSVTDWAVSGAEVGLQMTFDSIGRRRH